MTAPSNRTPKKEAQFLDSLRDGKSVTAAVLDAGFARQSAYDWRRTDADFAARWDAAVEEGTDRLEDEAHRRARDGVTKPVYQGGARIGEIQEYSDTLMIFLLKGRRRTKYGDKQEIMGKDGAPIETRTTMSLADLDPEARQVLKELLQKRVGG